jgi:hypothetical protein
MAVSFRCRRLAVPRAVWHRVISVSRFARAPSLAIAITLASPLAAPATVHFGDLLVFGDLSSQNLFRMRQPGDFQPVQQRNTARIGVDYKWLHDGKWLEKYSAPDFIDHSSVYLLYRGVYDSVYDWRPGGSFYTFTGARDGSFHDIPRGAADAIKYENVLREAYIDIDFADVPLSLRLGRQQIVWGETDNFRLLDRVNALDLKWHLQQEIDIGRGWDQLRIPYWMIKWLYRLDEVGPVTNAFVEGYWNPGDWYPNERGFLPFYPWSVPFTSPLPLPLTSSVLFRQGDYARNPADNSQVGVRFSGFLGGVNFTTAYYYQRWAGDDGSNTAAIRAFLDLQQAQEAVAAGTLPAEYTVPYVHTFGMSANYFEEWSEAVLKTETVYVLGAPFNDGDKRSPIPGFEGLLFGVSKRDMWQGMIGFDRPTWIRSLNRNATWLLTGQFFWHYLLDNERPVGEQIGLVGNLSPLQPLESRSGGPCPPSFENCKAVDRVRDWEMLMTLSATSFYAAGTIVPQLTYVLDPVNSFNMIVAWGVDYYLTNDFIVNLAQKYYVNTTEKPVYETWGAGGLNRGRSETQIRLTYQF